MNLVTQKFYHIIAKRKREKFEDRKKDDLYAQVKDSIQQEIDDRNQEKEDKRNEDEVLENKGIMDMISKQQAQLSSLIKQSRMGKPSPNFIESESKLVYENIQLTQRLKMLEEASQKRRQMIEDAKPKKKSKKKKKKHRKYNNFPMMWPGLPPMPPPMYGAMPPPGGGMPFQMPYQPAAGGYGSYDNGYGNNMSGLAGAGYQAMQNQNSYQNLDHQYRSDFPKNPADFEDKYKIVNGADINDSNKEELKGLLAKQLGSLNNQAQRERLPSKQ